MLRLAKCVKATFAKAKAIPKKAKLATAKFAKAEIANPHLCDLCS